MAAGFLSPDIELDGSTQKGFWVKLRNCFMQNAYSEEEYHSSKRPLLQRLAVQGAEIEARDVIVANPKDSKENQEEEWSVIDLKDENCITNRQYVAFQE
ncbi:hypothetical protein CRYUN_Cryun26dG0089400 [Craigia yunnanensis]